MESDSGIIQILKQSLDGADKDRQIIVDQVDTIKESITKLRDMVSSRYDRWGKQRLPKEFSNPGEFQEAYDDLLPAVGNVLLMVMPPSVFESYVAPAPAARMTSQQPIIIQPPLPIAKVAEDAGTSKGFLSGIWDYQRTKAKLKFMAQKAEKPSITTDVVTYDIKDIVYQLIPEMNKTKVVYHNFLKRHMSRKTVSRALVWHCHTYLQGMIELYFNVLVPFCRAAMYQLIEKVRHDKLGQMNNMSKIATAEAEARAMSMPWIPPEAKAFMKAAREGRLYSPDGFSLGDAESIAREFNISPDQAKKLAKRRMQTRTPQT